MSETKPPKSGESTVNLASDDISPASRMISNIRNYNFEELSAGGRQVGIEYRGKRYVLRCTRNGGLILNKD